MTKKYLIEAARYIRDRLSRNVIDRNTAKEMAYVWADVAKRHNPRFDMNRFLIACGL